MTSFSARSRFAAQENRLTRALSAARAEGRRVLDLTGSNPTEEGLSPTFEELAPLLLRPELARYQPEPFGLWSARAVLADALSARGFATEPARVLLTASTSEAYGYLFKLLCDPGDQVLVPAPSYPLFDVLAQLEQVELVPYRLAYDGEWHLDESSLQAARGARCKAVVVVHPNNPTGSFLKRSELAAIAALGLPIISDEVFADFAFSADQTRAESALEVAEHALVFRLSGLSKACALPQLKLAWTTVAGPGADAACARLEHIADAYLSPGTPVQLALPALLESAPGAQQRIRARVQQNLQTVVQALAHSAASVLRVEGGWYALVRLPRLMDDEAWALCLLEADDVLTQPGYYYDLPGNFVVLSLLGDPALMQEGMRRLERRVAQLSA